MTDNNLLLIAPTMSSREIAELTGKRHTHVLDDCHKLAAFYSQTYSAEKSVELVKSATYDDSTGRTLPCFALSKQASLDLVTGYSLPHRHAVNKRWQELEAATQKPALTIPDFTDPVAAARAWADELEAKRVLQAQIEADKPKIEFAMAVRNMDDTCTIEEFAKTLGTGRNRFFQWLRSEGIVQPKSRLPYQRYLECGWFKVIESKPWTDSDGNSHPNFVTRITGAGQVALEKRYRNKDRPRLSVVV